MPFFDAGSEFLGFEPPRDCGTLTGKAASPTLMNARPAIAPSRASAHKIASIAITHHRLPLAAAVQRELGHQATRALRCHGRACEHRQRALWGSLGRSHARLRGSRGVCSSDTTRSHSSAITGCCRISIFTTVAAGRSIWRCGTSPARSSVRRAGNSWADSPSACAPTPPPARCATPAPRRMQPSVTWRRASRR